MDNFMLGGTPIIIVPDTVIQKRKHKKNRINKKWRKRYGVYVYKKMKDGEVLSFDGKLYMNDYTYTKLKTELMYRSFILLLDNYLTKYSSVHNSKSSNSIHLPSTFFLLCFLCTSHKLTKSPFCNLLFFHILLLIFIH